MIFEHWKDPYWGDSFGDKRDPILSPDAVLCCVIEADTWTEAMNKYHQHQGWEPYRVCSWCGTWPCECPEIWWDGGNWTA